VTTLRERMDFVIITALQEERDAVLAHLPHVQRLPPTDDDIRVYYRSDLPTAFSDGSRGVYRIAVGSSLGMGRVEAANVTHDVIRRWHPRFVLLVGIAAGIAEEDVEMGDILIADQIVDFELQKIAADGVKYRWSIHRASPRLIEAARHHTETWQQEILVPRAGIGESRQLIGPVATGDKVIAFKPVMEQYREQWPKLIGVEMEAGGVASAAFQSATQPGFFMVRCVTDYADETKDDSWRAYACDAAATYAISFLERGPVPLLRNPGEGSASLDGTMFTTDVGDSASFQTLIDAGSIGQLSLPQLPIATSIHQLPPDIAGFIGRTDAIVFILEHFDPGERPRTSPRVVAISGMAGVGKSALAIHAAHRLKDVFPEGQLYQRMSGADGQRKSPADALAEMLRSLGVEDARIPVTLDERASLYRSLVDSHRYLIVLDDVQSEKQALPLLPGTPACGALITSRKRLDALDGISPYNLVEMHDDESLALLGKFCGDERVRIEDEAAREIASLCGYLPLALRIVGGRVRGMPGVRLADEAAGLRDESGRLERLNLDHLGIRSALASTYSHLTEEQRRVFLVSGMVIWADFPAPVPAHALRLQFDPTRDVLEELVRLQLLEGFGSGPDRRYRFHELVRLYAWESREREISRAERQVQRTRLTAAIAANASVLYQHMNPWTHKEKVEQLASAQGRTFADMQREVLTTTLTWFDRERDMLHVVATWAYEDRDWRATVSLAINLMLYNSMRFRADDSAIEGTQILALKAARELGDETSEALILNHLHANYRMQGRYDESMDKAQAAVAIWKRAGNPIAVGQMTDNIAILARQMGHPDLAADGHRRAIGLFKHEIERTGDKGIGHLLIVSTLHLGISYAVQGERGEAMRAFRECLELCREHGDRYREAEALESLGKLHIEVGNAVFGRATTLLNAACRIARELQDAKFEGSILYFLATIHRLDGRTHEADSLYREALSKVGADSPICDAINAGISLL